MADSERRYGPTIDLQGFELGTHMDTVSEPSRLPLVVGIALVVLAAFAGVVWLAYTQGVQRGRDSVSRELTAQEFWKLRKPAAPAYTGLKIYEPQNTAETTTKPATPAKRDTNAVPSLRPTASAAPDVPATTAHVAANPVTDTKTPAAPSQADRGTAAAPSGEIAPRVATHAPTVLTKPEVAPAPIASHPITEPDSFAGGPSQGTAAAPPAKKVVSTPPAPPAAARPKVAAPPAAAPVSTPPAPSKEMTGILLQIGSYKSDAEARASWQSFKSAHDAAAAYQSDVKQVDLGAKGTWYRLRMGPFADKKSALEACRKLKADGASCLVAQ